MVGPSRGLPGKGTSPCVSKIGSGIPRVCGLKRAEAPPIDGYSPAPGASATAIESTESTTHETAHRRFDPLSVERIDQTDLASEIQPCAAIENSTVGCLGNFNFVASVDFRASKVKVIAMDSFWPTIAGGVIALSGSIVAPWVMQRHRLNAERLSLKGALVAEIQALIERCKDRVPRRL
jgi:hypothetical protein